MGNVVRPASMGCLLLGLVVEACGPDDEIRVVVDLDWSRGLCAEEPGCAHPLRGLGLLVLSSTPVGEDLARGPGRSTLYSELTTPDGALAMLEIAYEGHGVPTIRYREIVGGEVTFRAKVTEQQVLIPEVGSEWRVLGEFSFSAVQLPVGARTSSVSRIVSNGRVVSLGEQGGIAFDGTGSWAHFESDGSSIPLPGSIDDEVGGCDGDSEEVDLEQATSDPMSASPDEKGDLAVDVEAATGAEEGSGCGGDEASTEAVEGSSCEGESTPSTSGGCEGGSGAVSDSGCEGDASSSSCEGGGDGCSGCEGDVRVSGRSPGPERVGLLASRRIAGSTFRLLWPIGLVACVNRWTRARLRSETPRSRRRFPRSSHAPHGNDDRSRAKGSRRPSA